MNLDSALTKDDNYYSQVLLKECEYIEENVARHIHDNESDTSYPSGEIHWMKNKVELGRLVFQKI